MSRSDPQCFPQLYQEGKRVCASCIGDTDLKEFIRSHEGPRGCSYCRSRHAPTMPLDELAGFVRVRLGTFYGLAVDQLPYESAEGGYQAWHVDTYDLLFDHVGLDLPRDQGELAHDLVGAVGDDTWCEYDWLCLDFDDSLRGYWERFCGTIKHERRFFFDQADSDEDSGNPDDRSLGYFLAQMGKIIDELNLVRTIEQGYVLYRARPRPAGIKYVSASELGPPPAEKATQSNRMNPPGIPMFYGAETRGLACLEVGAPLLSVGRFVTDRSIRVVDLADLPRVPGFFSEATREELLGLVFLREFATLISQPVPRDDRVHIEYAPTQVFTEFLRDFRFEGGAVDGIRYPSAKRKKAVNVVLFANQSTLVGSDEPEGYSTQEPWLRLTAARQLELPQSSCA